MPGADPISELGIYEVYYDENDNPDGWTEDPRPITVTVDSNEDDAMFDLEDIHKKIGEALLKPILDYNKEEDI